MTQSALTEMTIEQLVEQFIQLGIEEYNAEMLDQISQYNRLFRQMNAVEDELKSRDGDARRALIPLYNHLNARVRVMAAKATLAIAPQAARQALEAIQAIKWEPQQALDAGMCLWNLDRGVFVPT